MAGRAVDRAVVLAWLREAGRLLGASAEELTRLDAVIGDGDHGTNLDRGWRAALAALDGPEPSTPGAALVRAGAALISKTGGASGPLYGTLLRSAGKALAGAERVDPRGLVAALAAGLDGVCRLGGAAEGDKTMVDALAPAVAAATDALERGDDLATVTRAAADAAQCGSDATVGMQARKGRASYLGERSIGHRDPGAASMALVLSALAAAVAT